MIRGIGLRGGIALNVITMIGIGPLITIPLVLAQLHGALALTAWIAGALVALCDGLVWASLASRYPGSGGTYMYLREIFGAQGWGRFAAFLYNWQAFLSGSLILSTGCVGFAQYAGYLYPPAASNPNLTHLIAVSVAAVALFLSYRKIASVGGIGTLLGVVAVATLILVAIAGFSHGDVHRVFSSGPHAAVRGWGFVAALGGALFITLYDYAGYAQIAVVGEEVREPSRTIPRAIVVSILLVLLLYVVLQIGVLADVPQGTLTQFIGSTVAESAWGRGAGVAVTVLVLITAFASVYGGLIGAARVPFAAARDGIFFPWFARLHPTGQFPYIALLGVGAVTIAGCFFDLTSLIALLSTAGILTGSIAQIIALFVLAARGESTPFRMWLFPLPALVALAGWIYAFASTGSLAIAEGIGWMVAGTLVYLALPRSGMTRKRPDSIPS